MSQLISLEKFSGGGGGVVVVCLIIVSLQVFPFEILTDRVQKCPSYQLGKVFWCWWGGGGGLFDYSVPPGSSFLLTLKGEDCTYPEYGL